MSTYEPTPLTRDLVNATKLLTNVRTRIELLKVTEAASLLRIAKIEKAPGFQKVEDREYATTITKQRATVQEAQIVEAKSRVRKIKKQIRELSK